MANISGPLFDKIGIKILTVLHDIVKGSVNSMVVFKIEVWCLGGIVWAWRDGAMENDIILLIDPFLIPLCYEFNHFYSSQASRNRDREMVP